jgi:four helix bundle protein
MDGKQGYRDLVVWQRAIDLVPAVYTVVRSFPKHETYALSDQVRRAVVSIAANIAEGQARQHRKEFLQHLAIARGSLAEVHTLIVVAQRLRYVSDAQVASLENQLTEIAKPLNGLMSKLGKTAEV